MDSLTCSLYYMLMIGRDLVFLHSNRFPRCTATVDKHYLGYGSLQMMTRGGLEIFYEERRHEMRGAWFWPCFPGPRIRFHRLPGVPWWEHRYAAFQGPLMEQWLDAGLLRFEPQPVRNLRERVHEFDRLLRAIREPGRLARLRAINLLENLLLQLAEERSAIASEWLEDVEEQLRRQKSYWPDYAKLARDMSVGLSTLRRRFRKEAGVALHRHVMQRRLAAACGLLTDSDLPIKTVAERLGYGDVYFFSRQFRRIVGATPAQYRRSRQ